MSQPPRERVVVYRLGSLGDTVVALPSLHAIARAFPDAERILLTNVPVSTKAAPLEAILGGSGLVDRYMAYPVGTRSLAALWALRQTLRALGARTLVYLTPPRGTLAVRRDLFFFRLCGFTRIIGAPVTADLQHSRREPDGTLEQECQRLARCLAALETIDLTPAAAWDLHLSEAERQVAASALGAVGGAPRIAINMGGKVAANDWGEPNWRALIEALRDVCPDHALVFVGATEDAVRATGIGASWPGPVANLCGHASPRVSAAAMAGARVFVGHDSGPLHLAASVGVPCVGIFGNGNIARKWHPYGSAHRIIHEMRGVAAIRVEQVVAAIRAQLELPAEPSRPSESAGSVPAARPAADASALP